MFSKTDVRLERLTPELAKEFAAMTPMPGEREIKPVRLTFFLNHIKEGSFVAPTWAVGKCRGSGETYRLDGQHSSYVLANLAEDRFPKDLLVTIQTYEFDSLDQDSFGLFNLFDNPIAARSNTDIMGVHTAHHPDLKSLGSKFLVTVTNGIWFHEHSLKDGLVLKPRERGGYFANPANREFALWVERFRGSINEVLIKRQGVMAEIYADWKYNPAMALEFWSLVLTESHPDPDHETRELSRVLKSWKPKERKQDEFRKQAQKIWMRFRRVRELEAREKRPVETVTSRSPSVEGAEALAVA